MDAAPLPRPGLPPTAYHLRWAEFLHLLLRPEAKASQASPVACAVERHSAALLFMDPRGGVQVASAVAVHWRGKRLLATAGHNLLGVDPHCLWVLLDPLRRGVLRPLRALAWNGHVGPGGDGSTIDVGWIDLGGEDLPREGIAFLPEDQIGPGPGKVAGYLVQGVPARLVRVEEGREQRRLTLTPMTLCTSSPAPTTTPALEPGDIALDYRATGFHTATGLPLEIPPAPGLSGGGIWTFEEDGRPRLVGITRGWWPRSRQLRGTPIHHWQERVEKEPALR